MLFKKSFEKKTVNGVTMANGSIAFQSIRLNVHTFFIDGVLIDTGAKSLEKGFIPFFNELAIDQVVMTHFHEDHTGCAAFLQTNLNVPLYIDSLKMEYCKRKADYPLYRKWFWGKRKPFQAEPIGEKFQSKNAIWEVIKTPGHSIDHLAFLNTTTGQLFTGDLYCQEKTKVILREEQIPVIIDSLTKVLTYDFDEVFCSHAGYLVDGREALKRKLEYLLELQDKVMKLFKEGHTSGQINSLLFPKKYPIIKLSSGEWDSMHIVDSILKEQHFTS